MCLTPLLSNFSPFLARMHLCARCPVYSLASALKVQPVGFPCPSVDCELPESRFSLSPMPSTMPGPTVQFTVTPRSVPSLGP